MTPSSLYQTDLKNKKIVHDPVQADAINHLQCLYDQLISRESSKPVTRGLIDRIKNKLLNTVEQRPFINGLYLYGGVGRGKTYLMDLFFQSLPTKRKLRLHFHHFMLRVHKELTQLQGEVNPLTKIAKKFAKETDILCFDEFFVEDITDAMIISGVLNAFFAEGITLLATSNLHPDDLYKNGLQRARFLPTIALINQHCDIFNLDGGRDYRLGRLTESEIYQYPLDEKAQLQNKAHFENLAQGDKHYGQEIVVNNRSIKTIAYSANTLSIEFIALCDGPRSVLDYIEIAIIYRTIIVANVKQMDAANDDLARRFIAMVDEFYDHNVALIISAEVQIEQLYIGERLSFEFNRCISRLLEMQSKSYLHQAHH
ncbi:cell division protein ZapE [Psychromonas sp. MME2]|uniref:cell division protein ZapE n=1 Tax=unclassified Psychromonas TaxID=2614957 RepID=UPI00339CB096